MLGLQCFGESQGQTSRRGLDYPGCSSEKPRLEGGLDESSGWVVVAAQGVDEITRLMARIDKRRAS